MKYMLRLSLNVLYLTALECEKGATVNSCSQRQEHQDLVQLLRQTPLLSPQFCILSRFYQKKITQTQYSAPTFLWFKSAVLVTSV